MKDRLSILLLMLVFACPAARAERQKWALLVGIDQYRTADVSSLRFSVADVKSVAAALEGVGYPHDHIVLMTSDHAEDTDPTCPTAVNIFKRLDTLSRKIQPGDTFLFYFSGHGFQRGEGQCFLGAINTDPSDIFTLQLTTVPLASLQEKMKQIRAHHVIFILDACRNDPERGKGDSSNFLKPEFSKDLVNVAEASAAGPSGTAILFACSEGQRSWEWPEQGHGAFTYYLLQGMEGKAADPDGVLTVSSLAAYVQKQLAAWSEDRNKLQTPDLVLRGGARIVLGALPGPIPASGPTRTRTNPRDGAEMIFIPAGPFLMGASDTDTDAQPEEKPQHTVRLDGYWIYKNLVTVAMYRKFCDATGKQMPTAPRWGWKDDHPVVNVSWNDAKAYCDWAGVRLPTEAEWEKAARGIDGRKYPWGAEFDNSRLWCNQDFDTGTTAPVGSFPSGASPYGVLDMAGNVWQWCEDGYSEDYYKSSPTANPTGPGIDTSRVLRGGSWTDLPVNCRAARRPGGLPEHFTANSGFRCAVSR